MKRKIQCKDIYCIIRGMAKQASVLSVDEDGTALCMEWEELSVSDLLEWLEPHKDDYIEVSPKKG